MVSSKEICHSDYMLDDMKINEVLLNKTNFLVGSMLETLLVVMVTTVH